MPNPFADNPYQPPQQSSQPLPADTGGDQTGGLIPYKNPCALIAYYLGLFSLFPLLGFFLAVPAFVLGIMGLRARAKNPVIKGSVHAWIGIVLGGLMMLIWGGCGIGLLVTAMAAPVSRVNSPPVQSFQR